MDPQNILSGTFARGLRVELRARTHVGTANQPSQPSSSQVHLQLSDTARLADTIHESLNALEEKLAPVLAKPAPGPDVNTVEAAPELVPMADRIRAINREFSQISIRIADLVGRCEA